MNACPCPDVFDRARGTPSAATAVADKDRPVHWDVILLIDGDVVSFAQSQRGERLLDPDQILLHIIMLHNLVYTIYTLYTHSHIHIIQITEYFIVSRYISYH